MATQMEAAQGTGPGRLGPLPGVRTVLGRTRALGVAAGGGVAGLLPGAFLYAPEDAFQGPPQRIFYIHVPSAWVGFLAFAVVFVASVAVLVTRDRRWDDLAA